MRSTRRQPLGIDLFCGVGGMSLGFRDAGVNVAGAVDSDKINVAYHKLNFPDCVVVLADLREMSGRELRKQCAIGARGIDVVFGGPPCQGFSVGGKRMRDDPRNLLIFEFARLVGELQPKYFVMENVRGLIGSKHDRQLRRLCQEFREHGYKLVTPMRALNARHFGVPQDRSRLFLLGCKKGLALPAYPSASRLGVTVWDAIGDLAPADKHAESRLGDVYWGPLGDASAYAAKLRLQRAGPPLTGFAETVHSTKVISRFANVTAGERDTISRFMRLDKKGVSPTLRAGTGPDNGSFMAPRPIHPVFPRCVYTREAARLHSFPDWFQFDATLWHSFRQIGNSVPPALARAVAAEVVAAVGGAAGRAK